MITPRSMTSATAFALAFALFIAGSVSADEPTPAISGFVTFQGEPLNSGKIIFYLSDDEFVGSKVKNGAYKSTRVPVGAWKVSIEGVGMPAKYASGEATTLTVQVMAGTNVFDFDLK
jgi:hypothetical protein